MNAATREQMLERPLPHSADAERAILGALILDNQLISQAAECLRAEDFYLRAHQLVFRAMLALFERGSEINPILVGEELRREGWLEQVGGVPFISELTYGLPHFTNIAAYAKLVKDKSLLRRIGHETHQASCVALEDTERPETILESVERSLIELREITASDRTPLFPSFADFMQHDFNDGEEIAFHGRRGEVVLIQSVTNHGKSTLVRNAALALAVGDEFPPVVTGAQPRKVLLLNLEGAGGWFQHDIQVMTRGFTAAQMQLASEYFFPAHAPTIDGEPLSLSRHMTQFKHAARRLGGVDVLVIDTASMAFALRSENDCAEVANGVMKPLVRLARLLNCLIVLVHHIGKAKTEEGAAREHAHRGRGASAWADFSVSIFNLDADAADQTRVTLTCGKRKNGGRYETMLRLNEATRWLRPTDEQKTKPTTNDDLVLEAIGAYGRSVIATAEIEQALVGRVRRNTMMNCLNRLADAGQVESPRRGFWSLVSPCPSCHAPIGDWTTCTNCGGEPKPLLDYELADTAAISSNGNGFHG